MSGGFISTLPVRLTGIVANPPMLAAASSPAASLCARQVRVEDFHEFDLILAMDHDNLAHLRQMRPDNACAELDLFLKRYGLGLDAVPDPYYGGDDGFEHVLDLVEQASAALLSEVRTRL